MAPNPQNVIRIIFREASMVFQRLARSVLSICDAISGFDDLPEIILDVRFVPWRINVNYQASFTQRYAFSFKVSNKY